jgi:chain length determinant protein (polysaccharide antigen chain regulator)
MSGMNEGMSSNVIDQRIANNDEIDLFDLIDDIWGHKNWVFVGLFFTLLLAGIYLFKTTPVYQVEAKVKSATAHDLIEFSRSQLQGIYSLDVKGAFSSAQSALLSTGYRKSFYELKLDQIKALPGAYNESLSLEQNFADFSQLFSIKSGSKDAESHVELSLKYSDPELASTLLNDFVEYALLRSLRDAYDIMLAKINVRIEALNHQASIMREEYMANKARRILELKEADDISIAIGQTKPVYRNMDLLGGRELPLYMLGSKAIQAEAKALESRVKIAKDLARGEDHFIAGLPKILLEIEMLQAFEVDINKIHLARIDQAAVIPVSPIKPRKLLIVALALIAGIFVGLFMALIVAAHGKHKIRIVKKRKA